MTNFLKISLRNTYSLILTPSAGFLFFKLSIKRLAYFSTIGKIWNRSDLKKMLFIIMYDRCTRKCKWLINRNVMWRQSVYYINGLNLIRRVQAWWGPIHSMIHVKWNQWCTSLSRPLVNNGESEARIRFHFSSFATVIPSEKGPAKAIFASYTEKTYIEERSWLDQKQIM